MQNNKILEFLNNKAIKLAGAEVNGKACFVDSLLMKIFSCSDKHEFVKNYVQPTKIILDKRGEMWENHIIHVHFNQAEHDFYMLSALAVIVMAFNSKHTELYDMLDFAKDIDTSFFEDANNPDRRLKVGDKVEILVNDPDKIYTQTARINYLGKEGHIVTQDEEGYYHVVIDPHIPGVVFSPNSLRRVMN